MTQASQSSVKAATLMDEDRPILVFRRSVGKWVDGKIVEYLAHDFVRVQYTVEEDARVLLSQVLLYDRRAYLAIEEYTLQAEDRSYGRRISAVTGQCVRSWNIRFNQRKIKNISFCIRFVVR